MNNTITSERAITGEKYKVTGYDLETGREFIAGQELTRDWADRLAETLNGKWRGMYYTVEVEGRGE